jgi:hypothetical protein
MARRQIAFFVTGVSILVAVAGCGGSEEPTPAAQPSTNSTQNPAPPVPPGQSKIPPVPPSSMQRKF